MDTHGFPGRVVQLDSPDGGSARITPYGAHVLSWATADGRERLFLSPRAEYRAGTAIRGGVPVVFPQFGGMGKLPKHGFARTQVWEVAEAGADRAVFRLTDSEASRQIWPHRFVAEYRVEIGRDRLEMALSIANTDTAPFTFTAALHTYLGVPDLAKAAVVGLQGIRFTDCAQQDRESREVAERVSFPGEVDRAYLGAPDTLRLTGAERNLVIQAEGFPDAVVWNPGPEKCAAMGDLEPGGYQRFVCVEAAALARPVCLEPGGSWVGKQTLSL